MSELQFYHWIFVDFVHWNFTATLWRFVFFFFYCPIKYEGCKISYLPLRNIQFFHAEKKDFFLSQLKKPTLTCISFFLHLQTNVSIITRIPFRLRRRRKLLCLLRNGTDWWLPLQILWITMDASRWRRTTKCTTNMPTSGQSSIGFTLVSATGVIQQS